MSDAPKARLDKWLWYARFFKTRSLSAKMVAGGKVRVNGVHAKKASASVAVGDVLTFVQGNRVKVIEVVALGERRGPAGEAQGLYEDRSPPPEPKEEAQPRTGPRPTKRDRRQMERYAKAVTSDGVDPDPDAD